LEKQDLIRTDFLFWVNRLINSCNLYSAIKPSFLSL